MKINFATTNKCKRLKDINSGEMFRFSVADNKDIYMKSNICCNRDNKLYVCFSLNSGTYYEFYDDDVYVFNGVLNEVKCED